MSSGQDVAAPAHWTSVVHRLVQGRSAHGARLFVACLAFALAVLWASRESSPTFDEGGHVVAGLVAARHGDFAAYHHNPPLSRLLFALPSLGLSLTTAGLHHGGENSNWVNLYLAFARANRQATLVAVDRARLISLIFALLGALVAMRWAEELWGSAAGWLALGLFFTHPTLLAFAGLATPDMTTTTLLLVTFFLLRRWLIAPGWRRAGWLGLVLGLAQLSKFSALLAYPLVIVIALLWRPSGHGWRRWAQLGAALALSVVVINTGYLFDQTPTRLGRHAFRSPLLSGQPLAFNTQQFYAYPRGSRLAGSWLGEVPVPLPFEYVAGFDDQASHVDYGLPAYLAGTWRARGGWYAYYLVGFLVKTPLVVLLGLLAAGWAWWRRRDLRLNWREELILILPIATIVLAASAATGINSHYRYVMPALPFLLIALCRLAVPLTELAAHHPRLPVTVLTLLLLVAPVAAVAPYHLSYFNLLAGGPRGGSRWLLDSNIDWGQDLIALRRWLDRHGRHRPLYLYYFGTTPPSLVGLRDYGTTDFTRLEHLPPRSLVAISVNVLHGLNCFILDSTDKRVARPVHLPQLLRDQEPIAWAGHSIAIFER